MASDDDSGPPRRCSDEASSFDDVSDDVAGVKLGRSLSTGAVVDDVDKKLADELERLKSLILTSPKTSTTDDNLVSTTGPEETYTEDQDGDDSDFSSNNKRSVGPECTDEVLEDAVESELECAELESVCLAKEQQHGADYTSDETACTTGLHQQHRDSPASDEHSRLRAEATDDGDNVVRSTDLCPAASVVERLQEIDRVSSTEPSSAGDSKGVSLASAVQQSLSQANRLSSTVAVDRELNSAANNALVDVILEAERSLLSFLEIPSSTSCSSVNTSSKYDITCKTFSQGSQTFVSDMKETTEMRNQKLLKCDESCTVSNYTCQNCCLERPKNINLGGRILESSIKGAVGDECVERDEMTWSELKVLAEVLCAEQRLLVQLSSLHLQVAYYCEDSFLLSY